ncbi:hypothetical protein FKM82_023448 [Ascaphus truei]
MVIVRTTLWKLWTQIRLSFPRVDEQRSHRFPGFQEVYVVDLFTLPGPWLRDLIVHLPGAAENLERTLPLRKEFTLGCR